MLILSLGWLGFSVLSCAGTISVPPSPPRQGIPSHREETVKTPERPSPRALASLQLTEQGRMLLESGKLDDAIGVLERAIHLNPRNGQNYYYLSEAWLMKGNTDQAQEFNRLAGIYLEGDSEWIARVGKQKERIKTQRR